MTKYFAVSDTHGFYTYFTEALEEKGFFKAENKKLIVCGDLLDRGPEALKLVEFCLDLKEKGELIYIRGNHEFLFSQALQQIEDGGIQIVSSPSSHHYRNGTFDTLLQLSGMKREDALVFPYELAKRVTASRYCRELLPSAVNCFETEDHIFCHGWIPIRHTGERPYVAYDPEWRTATDDGWQDASWLNGMELCCRHNIKEAGKTVVCGHYHASYGHSNFAKAPREDNDFFYNFNMKRPEFGDGSIHSPFYADGIIAIDACTAVTKTVNCVVINENCNF